MMRAKFALDFSLTQRSDVPLAAASEVAQAPAAEAELVSAD
jgi:hypothetical protein